MPMGEGRDDDDPATPVRRRVVVEGAWALGTALLALVVGALSLRLWEWVPGTPFGLERDATQISMALKGIFEHGWSRENPDVGFPFGQNGAWFPELNVIHVAIVHAIGAFSADPFTPGVLYFVATFPLTGITGYLLARSQGLSRYAGLVLGVLVANAPGHQERFSHLYLAAYWVVPVCLWLVLEVARGRSLLSRGGDGRARWRGGRTLLTLTAVVLVGLSGVYYVAFTLVLLLVVTVVRRVVGAPRDLVPGLGVMGGLGAVIAVPLVLARLGTRGDLVTGQVPAQRSFVESETFAGKLMDLALPWPGHRSDLLEFVTFGYRATTRATVEVSALGVVGLAGFVALAGCAIVALVGGRPLRGDLGRWSGLTIVATAFYTVGGLGSFVAFFFTGQVRTWSRMSLFILVFALLAVGHWLTRLERRRGTVVAGALAAVLLLVGCLDQTNPDRAPDHRALRAQLVDLTRYTAELEAATEPGCAVFQVPVLPYPESEEPHGLKTYDQFLPYLTDADLRYSFGAMRGTARADWQQAVETQDVTALAQGLVASGFCALEVATAAFEDPAQVLTSLEATLGEPVASTADGRFVAFDLREAGAAGKGDTALAARVLQPVVVRLDAYEVERDANGTWGQLVGPTTTLTVANLGDDTVPVDVSMTVHGSGPEQRRVVVTDGGQEVASATVSGDSPATLTFPVDAVRGTTSLLVELSGDAVKEVGGDRTVSGRVTDLAVSAPPGVRAVALPAQAATGWVVP